MPPDSPLAACQCPAKINLTLAVTGQRQDGFHELHSLVAQTEFGDDLNLHWRSEGDPAEDTVEVRGMDLRGEESTVARAIAAFRSAGGLHRGTLQCLLEKRIPAGAGLGGGSSDAVAALRALASLFPEPARGLDLARLAADVGSDCPLFLHEDPVVMEGRGERLQELPPSLAARIRGRPVVLFKPSFAINTAEAYRRLAAGRYYAPPGKGQELLRDWEDSDALLPEPWNDFQRLAADWLPGIEVVLKRLRQRLGLDARLSGSGSACFAFHQGDPDIMKRLQAEIQSAWGDRCWMVETFMK